MKKNNFVVDFNAHFQKNFWLYIISFLCFCIGIVLGIYSVKYMGDIEKNDLVGYLKNFAIALSGNPIDRKMIFLEALKNNIIIVIGLWFLGLTMIGIPIVLIIDGLKGFTIGFSASFIINSLGAKGVGLTLLAILPQNIIYIPCILVASVISMELSLMLLRDKVSRHWTTNIWSKVAKYSTSLVVIFLIMIIGFLFEGYITPNIMKVLLFNVKFIYNELSLELCRGSFGVILKVVFF